MSIIDSVLGIGVALAAEPAVQQAATKPQPGILQMIWLPLLIVVVFYFLLIRPQSKRAKEQRSMLEKLGVGDEVMTTAGIVGKITRLKDNFLILRVAKDVEIMIQKNAIAAALPKGTLEALD